MDAVERAEGVDVHSVDDREPQQRAIALGKRLEGRLERFLERLAVAREERLELGIAQAAGRVAELLVCIFTPRIPRRSRAAQHIERDASDHRAEPRREGPLSRVLYNLRRRAVARHEEPLTDELGDLVLTIGAEPKPRERAPHEGAVGFLERGSRGGAPLPARVREQQVGGACLARELFAIGELLLERPEERRFVHHQRRVGRAGGAHDRHELGFVHLLRARDYHGRKPMHCLDETTVVDLLDRTEQRLAPEARAAAVRHIEACEACRELVVALSTDEAFFPTFPLSEGSEAPPGAADGERFGRFVITRTVGEGGVGVVHAAFDPVSRATRALKVLKDLEGPHAARFRREAKVAGALVHPGIVPVLEVVEHEGRVGLVSPLLEGESLDRRLFRDPIFPLAGAAHVLASLAHALAFAHETGVVHRDVKPQNVFLVGDPRAPLDAQEVKLLDFGLAKALGAGLGVSTRLTDTGVVLGTPHYMSPEQIVGETEVGTPSDAWALGVVAYECLAGVRPVEGKSFGQIFKRLTQETVLPLRERNLGLPGEVVDLVDALLRHAPGDRPTLAEAARVLEAYA